jgi:hypothetical protein
LDQQQLQIARAALWHQTAALGPSVPDPSAPLRTFDAAAQWLDDIGLCLFLPRHTQLPAPAPSFVEACLGAPAVTPAPPAIAEATEFLTRLVGERRIVPLNLLGAFSEQPDFLVTPEILPWVAAVRGDRQWKAAPAGRTTPIVIRAFEALDREGELTAIEVREIVGHEITEAAALRALMELWTGLRAMPIAVMGEPTRWTLLKNRFPAQLATGANTSQTTALSALLSLYLRSAVAATAEEAEVFLSPLTARSRIREVVHGMMATRQVLTTPVASQTLLFLDGSLPEAVPATEPELPKPVLAPRPSAFPKPPARKGPRPTRWELPPREAQPQDPTPPWQKKPAAAHRPQNRLPARPQTRPHSRPPARPQTRPRPASDRQREGSRPAKGSRPGFTRGFQQRSGSTGPRRQNSSDKPWQRRKDSFHPKPSGDRLGPAENRDPSSARPPQGYRPSPTGRPRTDRPRPTGRPRPSDRPGPTDRPRPTGRPGPSSERPARKAPWRGERPAPFDKNRKAEGDRPWRARPQSPPQFRNDRPNQGENKRRDRPQGPPFRKDRKSEGKTQRPWKNRPAPRGDRPEGSSSPAENRPNRPPRPFRPGKPFSGKPGRPSARGPRPARSGPPKNKFPKPSPAERNPRKNRSQEETPE